MLRAAVIQLNTRSDKAANLAAIETAVRASVARDRPDWIQLPEHCEWLGGSSGAPAVAEPYRNGATWTLLSRLSRELKVWIHGGSFYEQSDNPGRAYNTTVVFDRDGAERARYRKIHLFDVTTADGAQFHESATVDPGKQIVTYDCEGVSVGCSICYDVRFPELFQQLMKQGAALIAVPAAFTLLTGKDHWEVLLRSRAIETECWIAAAGQWGSYSTPAGERQSFGQSMIIDPWGAVVARVSDGLGSASAVLDMNFLAKVRQQIPVAANKAIHVEVSL
ncbi:nitrilase/cyanide hydratase and apolipoprotein N-acyltransferase [Novosphingobium sp. Rr 2-17]|uniref:carbon-nitrogen hydrolase family protein n=1 Tax=Novosphingobium sp. Rr 2-17 TaxID=555793 RepID=UPI000269A89E|nr:carbon-nitrogen hydrolase family protein [Novosphingobium sp. Rr 2-17]EIZ77231.1 nitrilase/cyanide hydratase and apolipoprotein N-acyltransferase [Novosphingobium sp. Rr 2-17]